MNGRYLFGLPFVSIKINEQEVEFLIDTGFNGSLLMPLEKIQSLGLQSVAVAEYALADGSITQSDIFEGEINWFGIKKVAVVSSPSDFYLLGMELLRNVKTTLEPEKNKLSIEK